MISYLLSVSFIWLVSLILFELLLKQETFHGWNRTYLLGTLLLGLVLPKVHWEPARPVAAYLMHSLAMPEKLHAITSTASTIASPYKPTPATTNWLLILYLIAVVVAAALLLLSGYRLMRLTLGGTKRRLGGFTLIETGRDYPPCSFLRCVFINSIESYEAGELEMILAHEQRHIRLGHTADILLISLLRVVLPFHPLLWWYRSRLQLVHEYQADAPARQYVARYGHFLLEHQLLMNPLSFAHSIFHSPIKNRIVMLTKTTSSNAKRAKYLLMIPVTAALLLACNNYNVKPTPPQASGKNKIVFRGNEFELSAPETKSIQIKDSTGKIQTSEFTITPYPIKMNGETIYSPDSNAARPKYKGTEGSLAGYLHKKLQPEFDQLLDGVYNVAVEYPVIDKGGRMVYYGGVHLLPDPNLTPATDVVEDGVINISGRKNLRHDPANEQQIKTLEQQMSRLLDRESFAYEPAVVKGRPVISLANEDNWDYRIVIKNHQSWVEPVPERVGVAFSIPGQE